MAFDADEEILQDFLVEAGEILEKLSEQLVDLERHPDDSDLLNAIFRGFHTVKGGAGFLQLEALVNCCHSAENVFDILRNHKRKVDSELMDVVLEALDYVNAMFEQVRNHEELTPAPDELIARLDALAQPEGEGAPTAAAQPEQEESEPAEDGGDITDDEFEQLLDALQDEKSAEVSSASSAGSAGGDQESSGDDEITDDEFEALLDQLHGKGQFAGAPAGEEEASGKEEKPAAKAGSAGGDDLITDDEFEKLLDDLHGKGGSPTAGGEPSASKEPAAPKQPSAPKQPASSKEPASAKANASKPEKSKPAEKPEAKGAAAPAMPARENAPAAETTVRVDTKRLDDIMNMVGELVLVRNRLQRLGAESEDEHMHKAVSNLDVVTTDLQSAVMQTRMQPIKKVFGRFPRVVRDLARNLKKEVNLVMHGEETDLDKNLVEALSDPLVHLVRNSVDHGIEAPEVREKAGKPRQGTVTLSAEQEGDHILLFIEDDGAGMDPEVLRRKAVEKGIYDQDAADRLTNSECYNLIFAAGFSTKEQISDVSGRGVGMDVVKTKIGQLNGQLSIESELGKGSRIVIKVPLTLAIMPTLMIMLGDQSFALPLVNVVEIFHLDLTKTNIVDGRECIVVRDKVFPLFHIKRWLVRGGAGQEVPDNAHVVIVAMGTKQVGFVVDQLVGQEEVVIKPLGRALQGTPGMAGATITGDGRIALIIDVPSLLQHYG
ncbi:MULTISPECIES: chemotaxis protein CheA [unclassified Marinobacter]|jgi:two-component system chemotaxis sensor kinase CheA|uniref:chemotaxis protein CheA n=1 Tax=Marinobacter TaxID=2742 RepID=UPI0007881B4E|nr:MULTISPECIES: chemotaxis protein CheA [unclassified Marinobacter]MAK51173.1 chemotaxis protein CheA [Marinobacter sp.]MCR9188961.1 chemotaxis protein CheA [Alteromonadaceae bacterium]MCW8979200.1 chemotaxis protein CheA [Marinobacter sp.]|tara:strand:- start:1445 stop:3595 length:2151 start_codon:yes stop_codon:yes gene_type:complete|eukprot:TRINITY_DN5237_c1_g2_i1.p3 TRINITY_DN5237_c1_g2~~TRINITY_DN5237_c1_g2_i1.p3  ORF type:complete len:717 (-),score=157.36 TRINITY_DN5237_c1_g2_i1:24360-26510(-)